MSAHPPPVPPANRSPKGIGSDPKSGASEADRRGRPGNSAEQGQTGNTSQNTHNQGYEQDR